MLPRFLGAAFDAIVMCSAAAEPGPSAGPSLARAFFESDRPTSWDGRSSRNGNGRHSGVAAVRRAARKRRNVLRHRRASR